jgi:DNA-binding transcriptional MerR regulator
MAGRTYLSIGEVLSHLRDEFPDVTISKIRFLEAQGLIEPERTPSGYRKFHQPDVERLRFILREQTANFLPLKVIKERLEVVNEPDDMSPTSVLAVSPSAQSIAEQLTRVDNDINTEVINDANRRQYRDRPTTLIEVAQDEASAHVESTDVASEDVESDDEADDRSDLGDVSDMSRQVTRRELLRKSSLTAAELDELEEFGVVSPQLIGGDSYYSPGDFRIIAAAARLQKYGLGGRHLRAARMAADREVGLYEQIAAPYMRQHSATARTLVRETLLELIDASTQLHSELLRASLGQHLNPDVR